MVQAGIGFSAVSGDREFTWSSECGYVFVCINTCGKEEVR